MDDGEKFRVLFTTAVFGGAAVFGCAIWYFGWRL